MIESNFYITAFIWLPLSVLFVVAGIVMVATTLRENRISLWIGTAVAANASVQFGLGAFRGFAGVDEIHAAMLLITLANFWAGTMLMLANAVRFEVNRRTTGSSNEPSTLVDHSNDGVAA
jgi:heme A synthase